MPTPVLRVLDQPAKAEDLERAGAILREGGLVAFPTETVYGIAASARHPEAIERLYAIKRRPRTKPMTVMITEFAPLIERCGPVPAALRPLVTRFWPGPLTLVLPALQEATAQHEARSGMVGFRVPDHPLAQGLIRAAGVPLLVPSANRAGEPPATTAQQVLDIFPEELDLVIDGGPSQGGTSSTVVQFKDDKLTVLREGAIPEARVHAPDATNLLFVCTGNTDRSPLAVAIVKRRLAERLGCSENALPVRGILVSSAGVSAVPGRPASRHAQEVGAIMFKPGLDLESHVSRRLSEDLVREASRVICMERAHRDEILAFFPHRERDIVLLDPEGHDVADPVGRDLPAYERLVGRLDAVACLIVGSLLHGVR